MAKKADRPQSAKNPPPVALPPDVGEARKVLDAFIAAGARGDKEAMKACLTRRTVESGNLGESPEGMKFVVGEPIAVGDAVVFPIRGLPDGAPQGTPAMELPARMVKEDGAWKFDLIGSVEGMVDGLADAMKDAMGQVAQAMSTAMEGVGKALSEGLNEAFKPDAAEVKPGPGPKRKGKPKGK